VEQWPRMTLVQELTKWSGMKKVFGMPVYAEEYPFPNCSAPSVQLVTARNKIWLVLMLADIAFSRANTQRRMKWKSYSERWALRLSVKPSLFIWRHFPAFARRKWREPLRRIVVTQLRFETSVSLVCFKSVVTCFSWICVSFSLLSWCTSIAQHFSGLDANERLAVIKPHIAALDR
jgi:hypothetical protein